jgi:hypothetical protein
MNMNKGLKKYIREKKIDIDSDVASYESDSYSVKKIYERCNKQISNSNQYRMNKSKKQNTQKQDIHNKNADLKKKSNKNKTDSDMRLVLGVKPKRQFMVDADPEKTTKKTTQKSLTDKTYESDDDTKINISDENNINKKSEDNYDDDIDDNDNEYNEDNEDNEDNDDSDKKSDRSDTLSNMSDDESYPDKTTGELLDEDRLKVTRKVDGNNEDNEDNETKLARENYIKHMDKIVNKLKRMDWGDIITFEPQPYPQSTPSFMRKLCTVIKVVRYNTYMFNGFGSKMILKYFINKTKTDPNHSYKKIVQILDKNSYRRFLPIRDWESFWEAYSDEPIKYRYLFELIKSDQPCKPYLDIEWEVDNPKKQDARKKSYTKFIKTLRIDLIKIFAERYGIDINNKNIMITSSHSAKKTSFHVVINKIINGKTVGYRTNCKGLPESAWDLWLALTEHDDAYSDVLDGAVYTTDREFRAIFSNKTTDYRPIIPYVSGKNILPEEDSIIQMSKEECFKYLVTYSKNNEYYNIVTPPVPKQYACTRSFNNSDTFVPRVYSDKKINELMNLVRTVHISAEYTGVTNCGKGWRFSYSDKHEPCYTGNYHDSNGFYVFDDNGRIYMKCLSSSCKGTKVLKKRDGINLTKKLF